MKIDVLSIGKVSGKNEDSYGHSSTCFVVCDGSTSKKDGLHGGRTGGAIASEALVNTCLESDLNGVQLVDLLTGHLVSVQQSLGVTPETAEFGSTLLCARICGSKVHITQVADTSFRINGTDVYDNPATIDELMSATRAHYIRLTGDVEGGRKFIMPLLLHENVHCNNAESTLGFGVINGTPVPAKFVRTYEFDISAVSTIEIYSDGYYGIPAKATIEDYEELYGTIERRDPDKCLDYPSTKSKDDRTVMIVRF